MAPKRKTPTRAQRPSPYPSTLAVSLPVAQTVKIADNGDIVLLVGEEAKQRRLQVSSFMLRAASKTFNVMFGPDFQEGRELSFTRPKDVMLPDDDPEAIELICRIVHLHNDELPETLKPDQILSFARLVDKYELHRTVYLAADRWLVAPKVLLDESIKELGKMMLAADLMNHERGFGRITKAMVYDTNESCLPVVSAHHEEDLWSTIYLLERHRNILRSGLDSWLHYFAMNADGRPSCACCFENDLGHACMNILKQLNLGVQSVIGNTITAVLGAIDGMKDEIGDKARKYAACDNDHGISFRSHFAYLADTELVPQGLCLHCTRFDRTTMHNLSEKCPIKAAGIADEEI